MGLVMEQIRNRASGRIGLPASRSSMPCDLNHATLPWRTTSVTAPATRLSSMLRCTVALMRSSRSDERPTASGLAVGRSCATAAAKDARMKRPRRIGMRPRFLPAAEVARHMVPSSCYDESGTTTLVRRLDGFRSLVPRYGTFAEVRLVGHVAGDRGVVAEDRIFCHGLTRLDRLEKHVEVRTHVVPVVAVVDHVIVDRLFA